MSVLKKTRCLFRSTQQTEVFGQKKTEGEWEKLGRTPGTIELPPEYDIGIKVQPTNDRLATLVQDILSCSQVQLLDLSQSQITDTELAQLAPLTSLTSLYLHECKKITDVGLAYLEPLVNLTVLGLAYTMSVSDAGLAHLKALSNLTALDLQGCFHISDAGLAHLKALSNFTALSLQGCLGISDVGLALRDLTKLKSLDLAYTFVTGERLMSLKTLSDLARLSLSGNNLGFMTSADLVHLQAFPRLTYLNLSDCSWLNDAGLEHLKTLASLTHLDLSGCTHITDVGLAHLQSLTNLTELGLPGRYWNTNITDRGLASLRRPGLSIIMDAWMNQTTMITAMLT
jgi:hypothetical protein